MFWHLELGESASISVRLTFAQHYKPFSWLPLIYAWAVSPSLCLCDLISSMVLYFYLESWSSSAQGPLTLTGACCPNVWLTARRPATRSFTLCCVTSTGRPTASWSTKSSRGVRWIRPLHLKTAQRGTTTQPTVFKRRSPTRALNSHGSALSGTLMNHFWRQAEE